MRIAHLNFPGWPTTYKRSPIIAGSSPNRRDHLNSELVGKLRDGIARAEIGQCNKAILLPHKANASLTQWLDTIGINVIWEDGPVFLDNANGQFTLCGYSIFRPSTKR